jgi:polysaccharide export outer membrane protein
MPGASMWSGRTPAEIERDVLAGLAGKAIEPQVLVTVTRSLSNAVTVTGEVTNGARIPLSPAATGSWT